VRALALLRGKSAASIDELKDAALPVLRHRITPNYNATGEGITEDEIITKLIS
jgi:MoxR-like ATPase